MKNIIILFILTFSVSVFAQTEVIEEWQDDEINEQTGEVETEILVYLVQSEGKTVARFFPREGEEEQTSQRAKQFAKNYKKQVREETKRIKRKKKKKGKKS